MKKKIFTLLTLLVTFCSGAWAEDTEVTLPCASSQTYVGTKTYESVANYQTLIRLNSYAPEGGAGAMSFILDNDFDASKVKSAVLKFYPVSKPNKNRSGSIYIRSLDAYPSVSSTSTSYSDGKHIVYSYGGSTTKRYAFSTTTIATIAASAYTTSAPAQGNYYGVDVTSYIQGMTTKSPGDAVYFGMDINDFAFDTTIGAYGHTNAPKLVITYSSETLYTATFTANSGAINPTVTIYSDSERTAAVSNGTLTDGTTYYYTATLAGYNDYQGSFTVASANPSVSFTMTAKTAVASVIVKYKESENEITSEVGTATGLYVGETATIPYRMYVTSDGKLYKAAAENSDPYYGKSVKLTENTVVEISVTEQDLYGGTIAFFKDFDSDTGDNANIRASYCSAYGNRSFTSDEPLTAGNYKFIFRAQNKGRGSSVAVGEQTIFEASAIAKNSWGDYTLTTNITTGGNITFVAGSSSTYDYYDIIIAIKLPSTVTATVTSVGWATFCSPLALNFEGSDLNAYIVTGYEGTAITKSAVTTVAANTPVLVNAAAGNYSVTVAASGTDYSATNCLNQGTGAAVEAATGYDRYVLVANEGVAEFQKIVGTAATVASTQAYLQFATVGGSRILSLDGETTGIDTLNVERGTLNDATIYNIAGQRVAQPTKGLYIVNGKKVVMK